MLTKEEARGAILGYYVLYNRKGNTTLVNRTVDEKETTSHVITSLKEFTSYEFAIQAFNGKGAGNESSTLEKKTDQDSKFISFQYFISHISNLECNLQMQANFHSISTFCTVCN